MRTRHVVGAAALSLPLVFGASGPATAAEASTGNGLHGGLQFTPSSWNSAQVAKTIEYDPITGAWGCEVWQQGVTKVDINPTDGQKRVWFRLYVFCNENISLRYQQDAWEQDIGEPGDVGTDDRFGHYASAWIPFTGQGKFIDHYWTVGSGFDAPDRWNEFYQAVRFQVKEKGQDPHPWTLWKSGPVTDVFV